LFGCILQGEQHKHLISYLLNVERREARGQIAIGETSRDGEDAEFRVECLDARSMEIRDGQEIRSAIRRGPVIPAFFCLHRAIHKNCGRF